jgi:hypothetical protein
MRQIAWLIAAGLALCVFAVPARAQRRSDEFFQRDLFLERDIRQRLDAAAPAEQKTLIEWGGFYSPSYTYFTDLGGNNGNMTFQDFRLWTQIRLDDVHRIYARMRLDYTDFAAGDAQGLRAHDLRGPNLEIGYYELDVTRAVEKYWKCPRWPAQLFIRGGRQYIEVGRGIALGEVIDAGSFDLETKDFAFTGFAGRSPRGQNVLDQLQPGYQAQRSDFYGGQFRYTGIDRHEPYAYFVFQRPRHDNDSPGLGQDFEYSSEYYGIGSHGALATNLRYAIESIWQFGRSSPNGVPEGTEKIRAYAFDAEVDYYIPQPMKPVVGLEYAFASGDGDRRNAVSSFGGNRAGTVDNEFQGFGFVNSGLALAARFANLQFVRLTGRMTPYERKAKAGRIDVGTDFYFLWKADRLGPISDFRADRGSASLGHEVDVFVEWRILSDLSWTLRYGRFFPGAAYSDRDPHDYLFTGLNFSF